MKTKQTQLEGPILLEKNEKIFPILGKQIVKYFDVVIMSVPAERQKPLSGEFFGVIIFCRLFRRIMVLLAH